MWWRRLFRRDAMMIRLMRATEKDGDGTLDQANRRIIPSRALKAEKRSDASKGTIWSRPARSREQPLHRLKMR